MLEIHIPEKELYDIESGRFFKSEGIDLHFEHSLLSLTEWEMKYRKPFFGTEQKTDEEYLDYIRMMCFEELKDEYLSSELVTHVIKYMQSKPSATKLSTDNDSNSRRIMTSEVIYAYMANAQIPYSCESWNIQRLFYLLGVIGELNKPAKKMSPEEAMRKQAMLNQQRLAEEEERRRLEENTT